MSVTSTLVRYQADGRSCRRSTPPRNSRTTKLRRGRGPSQKASTWSKRRVQAVIALMCSDKEPTDCYRGTADPCYWVDKDLWSACASALRRPLPVLVQRALHAGRIGRPRQWKGTHPGEAPRLPGLMDHRQGAKGRRERNLNQSQGGMCISGVLRVGVEVGQQAVGP